MLILPAAPAGQVSGKQDDSIVYFTWRGIQSARSYRVPANPRSGQQTIVRNVLSTLTKTWKTLTDAQRQSWADLASTLVLYDRLGRPFYGTPLNAYVIANTNMSYMGLSLLTTAGDVSPDPVPAIGTVIDYIYTDDTMEFTLANNLADATLRIKVQMEILPSPAWTARQSRSRFAMGVGSASYVPVTAVSGSVTYDTGWNLGGADGQIAAVWLTTVSTVTGLQAQPLLLTHAIEAI